MATDAVSKLLTGTNEEKIEVIKQMTEDRLKVLLGGAEYVPEELAYIVTEVSVARFNRIGSEGLSSHAVEGETMQWSDGDFSPYRDDIDAYLDAQDETRIGRVRFL